MTRIVVDEHGRRRRVQLYVLAPGWAKRSVPSASYLGVIARAYRRLGFDRRALLASALEMAA